MIGEVGIFLSPQAQSKGATEAAGVLFAYGFKTGGLHRITSGCDTENPASFRQMERLGMRREGHLPQSRFWQGAPHSDAGERH